LDFFDKFFEKKEIKYLISYKSVKWRCFVPYRQPDGWRDLTNLIVVFRNSEKRALKMTVAEDEQMIGL